MTMRPILSSVKFQFAVAVLAGASVMGFAATGSQAAEATTATAKAAGEPTPKTPAAKRGDALFHQRCIVCHNKKPGDNAPFGPPNLYHVFRDKVLTVAQATQVIHKGMGPMPAFGDSITDSQIRDVVAYLSSH